MTPDPFHPICKSPFYFETAGAADTLRRLEDGFGGREPFLLLTGEAGTGKTTFANAAMARWEARVVAAFLAGPVLSGAELLEEIVMRWGGEPPDGASRPKLVGCFERELARIAGAGKIPMVVVDDAQNLSPALLEELRLLVNAAQRVQHPMEVMLIGLPSLEVLFDNPALGALRQRVSVRARIEPLTEAETRRYLRHRAGATGRDGANMFPRKTCIEIASMTGGVPRRINTLASEALRLAQVAGDPAVLARHLRAVAESMPGSTLARSEDEDVDPADSSDTDRLEAPESEAPLQAITKAPAKAAPAPAVPARAKTPAPAPARAKTPAPAPAKAPAPVLAKAPAPPSARAQTPAPAPARAQQPAPTKKPVPAQATAASSAAEIADPPVRVIPASHDANEWVARFIGDQGPVRIGAQVLARANWSDEFEDPIATNHSSPPAPPVRSGPSPAAPPRRGAKRGHLVRATTVGLAATLAVAAATFLIFAGKRREQPSDRATTAAARPADTETRAAVTPPAMDAFVKPSEPSPGSRDSTHSTSPATSSPQAVSPAPRDTAKSSGETMLSPTGRYTLDVGGFRDLYEAFDARNRIAAMTGIETWVIAAPEGSGEPNRIVLGKFSSPERAADAAKTFLKTQTFDQVKVVPLPRRSARQ